MLNAFVSDAIDATPALKILLEPHRMSNSKLRKMIERYGGEKLEKHQQSGPFHGFGIDGKEGPVRLKHNKYLKLDKSTLYSFLMVKLSLLRN